MANEMRAVGLSALGAAMLLALPTAAQAWHEHWFFDSYGYYEGQAFAYPGHPPMMPGRFGPYFGYQPAPGHWGHVHPRAVFPQYAPPAYRMVEPRRRWRAHPRPETARPQTAEPEVLPRQKPQIAATRPSAPESEEALKPDPQATGSIDRAPADVDEPKTAASGGQQTAQAGKQMSCEAAAEIVGGFGFAAVKPTSCSGSTYGFEATRDGAAYSIQVSATNGELTGVKKR